MASPKVRFRIDFGARCKVGIGKIELLESIERTGSLSSAARSMRMSYRRAWLLLADLNASFDDPVVDTATGGAGGGGATLTPFGAKLIASYRLFDSKLQPLAERCLNELSKCVASEVKPAARRLAVRPPAKRRARAG